MENKNRNSNEKNLIKYSLSLLIVAMVFIAIGGISLSRSINRGDDRIMTNFNVNDKVKEISDRNLKLTQENAQLKKEIETALTQKATAEKENTAYELYLEALNLKESEPEKHEELIKRIKELEISDDLKTKLTGEE